jgi:hypothetical protein
VGSERNVGVDHGLDHPDEESVEQVADGDRDDPAGGSERDGLGGEDAADVPGAGADGSEDADFAVRSRMLVVSALVRPTMLIATIRNPTTRASS